MPGPLQLQTSGSSAELKPALMVLRAQQIVVELGLLAISILSLLIHSFSRRRLLKRLLVIPCLYVVMTLISLALSTTWLVKTASPKARARSLRGGARPPPSGCLDYTCDYLWDVVLALVWAVMIFPAAITRVLFTATLVLNIVLLCMFITSAVLSGLVRKRMRLEVGGPFNMQQQELAMQQQRQQQQQHPGSPPGGHVGLNVHSADTAGMQHMPSSRTAAVL